MSSPRSEPDVLDADDDLQDLWDSFAARWEQEFRKFNESEDTQLSRVANRVHIRAEHEAHAYEASVAKAIHEGDARARHISERAGIEVEVKRHEAVAQVRLDAEQQRLNAFEAALDGADDLARRISDGAAARRREREAKRAEERRARAAEIEARAKARRAQQASGPSSTKPPSPPSGSARNSAAGGAKSRNESAPPKFTRAPGSHIGAEAATRAPVQLNTFPAFDAAWVQFERRISKAQGACFGSDDVPWPHLVPTVCGIGPEDGPKERKTKLRAAVLRWHPDKWAPILAHIREDDRPLVMEKVKQVTQRILDERKRFSR